MKKIISFIMVLTMLMCVLSSCGFNEKPTVASAPITKSAAQIEQEEFNLAKEKTLDKLRDMLKNPNSLQVNNVYYKNTMPSREKLEESGLTEYIDKKIKFIMRIDYSAQNGFGGMNRSEIYAACYEDGSVKLEEDYTRLAYLYALASYVEK